MGQPLRDARARLPIRDATSGYRAFRVDTLKAADYANTRSKGYGFQIELCYRVWQYGGRIAQVPIAFTDRVRGHSKMSLSVGAEELGLVVVVGDSGPRAQGALAPLRRHPSRFAWLLLAIVVVALGIRVSYVAIAKAGPCDMRDANGKIVASEPSKCLQGDELFYNAEANYIAAGHGFNEPYGARFDPGAKHRPAADHPPLTVLVLTPVAWLSDHPPLSWMINEPLHDHVREDRYTMVVLGTVLVVLVGLLGRRLGGDTVGLVAAAIAAVAPNLWVNDGLVMSETVTGLMVVGAMLSRVRGSGTGRRFGARLRSARCAVSPRWPASSSRCSWCCSRSSCPARCTSRGASGARSLSWRWSPRSS